MPEGHVLHRIAGILNDTFSSLVVESSSPQGRFADSANLLDGMTFGEASAWGKHLFVGFEQTPLVVNIHLGLLGKFAFTEAASTDDAPPIGAVRWRLAAPSGAGVAIMDLRGPNVCELRTPEEVTAIQTRLGPDPLRADADPDRAWQRIHKSSKPIASLLMDQQIFAGVGNIYRAEVLFRHHLDPKMPGKYVRPSEFTDIWADLVALMPLGVRDGRIDTVLPEHTPEAMGREPRVDAHGGEVYVYRRAGLPCLVCGTPIRMEEFAARNLFWCPTCQPHHRRRKANAYAPPPQSDREKLN